MKKRPYLFIAIVFTLSFLASPRKSYAQLAWSIDSISVSPQIAVNTNFPIKVYGKMYSSTHGDCDSTFAIVGDTIFIGTNFRETCNPVINNSWSTFANPSVLLPGRYYIKATARVFQPNLPAPAIRIKVKSIQVGAISGLSNNVLDHLDPKISLFPNPASERFSIRFNNPTLLPHQVIIFNSLGQVVRTVKELKTEEIKIERENLPNGVYFYQLVQDKNLLNSGKLILK